MQHVKLPSPLREHREQLDKDGFVVLQNCVDQSLLEQLVSEVERIWTDEGELAGTEFKQEMNARRLSNLVDKSQVFEPVVLHRYALALVGHILGEFKLSSLNARSANPMSASGQPLHCDGGCLPDDQGPIVANVVWCLDDFNAENGTLRVVPGTHRSGSLPQDVLVDPELNHPDQKMILAKAGSLIVVNAHLWHSGTENCTKYPRRAVHAFYCRRDHPQQQFQQRLLSTGTKSGASGFLRYLLALDDKPLEDEIRQSNSVSGFLK